MGEWNMKDVKSKKVRKNKIEEMTEKQTNWLYKQKVEVKMENQKTINTWDNKMGIVEWIWS